MDAYECEQADRTMLERHVKPARRRQVFEFQPVGMDVFSPTGRAPKRGTLVVKTQPAGCPRNGTMGHCYIEDASTGAFYGLVLQNSLKRVSRR